MTLHFVIHFYCLITLILLVFEPHTYIGTTLSLPSIQLQSSPASVSPQVPQATREGIHSQLTTKPQTSDMNTVKTTSVAKTSVSPTVVTSGPRVSTGAVTLNGSADLASQERTTPIAQHRPPSSISPRQPPSTQSSSTQLPSLGDGGQPLPSSAGGHTTTPQSLPRNSHLAATKTATRGKIAWIN